MRVTLDGLDEVPVDKRVNLEERLQRFAQNYRNEIYLSSRIASYSRLDIGVTEEHELLSFNQEQIENYIAAWFINAAEHLSDETVSADKLIEELDKKPLIYGLTKNPLMLSMICSLYQMKSLVLPTRRKQLYDEIVQRLLMDWRRDHSHSKTPPNKFWVEAKKKLLGWIAYEMTRKGYSSVSEEQLPDIIDTFLNKTQNSDFRDKKASFLITELTEEDGILYKPSVESGSYLFLYRTFQEYFTAFYMSKHSDGIKLATEYLWKFEWHEIITFMAEMLDEPIPLIQAIVDKQDDIFSTQLLLAGQCLAQLPAMYDPLIEELVTRIHQFWQKYPKLDFAQRVVISLVQGEATRPIILKLISEQLKAAAKEDQFWGQRETIRMLIALGSPEELAIAIDSFPIRAGRQGYDLENVTAKQAVAALNYAHENAAKIFYFFKYDIFGEPMDERLRQQLNTLSDNVFDALGQALKHEEYRFREDTSDALCLLAKLGVAKTIPVFINALENNPNDDVRQCAAEALAEFQSSHRSVLIPVFRKALTDSYWLVRKYVFGALIGLKDIEFIPKLISVAKNCDRSNENSLSDELSILCTPEAITVYRNCLVNADEFVKTVAVKTLEKIAASAVVPAELELKDTNALEDFQTGLKNDDELVRIVAARALSKIGTAEAVADLRLALHDTNKAVRQNAVQALGKIGDAAAISCLCEILGDCDSDIKLAVVKAYGQIAKPELVPDLERIFQNANHEMQVCVIDALANIGNSEAIESLCHIFHSAENDEIRFHAAEILAKAGNTEAINFFVDISYDDTVSYFGEILRGCESDFRLAVAKAFEQIAKPEFVPDIDSVIDALSDIGDVSSIESLCDIFRTADNPAIRLHAAEVLAKAGATESIKTSNYTILDGTKGQWGHYLNVLQNRTHQKPS